MTDPDRLRAELRDAAAAYQPDRGAIASRAAARRAAAQRRDRLRPVLAAAAVLGVAVASVVGVQLSNESDPAPVVAIAPPATTPAEPAPATSEPKPTTPGTKAPPSSKPATVRPSFMECAGTVDKNSVATWTQNTVTVHTKKAADDVEVTITVPRAGDSRPAGRFSTVPNTDLEMSVKETAKALVYTFKLRDGAKLAAGTWVFAAQFEHRAGRDKADDSYAVDATSDRSEGAWNGNFSRT